MLNNFIYAKQKSLFEEALNNGEVLDEAIVFIEDTKEIWNHGTYFDGSKVDLSDIETSILNIVDNYATKTEIPTKVSLLENDSYFVTDTLTIAIDWDEQELTLSLIKSTLRKLEISSKYAMEFPRPKKGELYDRLVNLLLKNGYVVEYDNPDLHLYEKEDITGILITGAPSDELEMYGNTGGSNAVGIVIGLDWWYDEYESYIGGANRIDITHYADEYDSMMYHTGFEQTKRLFNDDTSTPVVDYCVNYSCGCKTRGLWYVPSYLELEFIPWDLVIEIMTRLGITVNLNIPIWSSSYWSEADHEFYMYSLNGEYSGFYYSEGTPGYAVPVANYYTTLESGVQEAWLGVQTLINDLPTKVSQLENDANYTSSDNLKTINGESILGEGNITISGGSSSSDVYYLDFGTDPYVTEGTMDLSEWDKLASARIITVKFGFNKTASFYCTTAIMNKSIHAEFIDSYNIGKIAYCSISFLKGSDSITWMVDRGITQMNAYYKYVTNETVRTIEPNEFYVWDEVASLDLSFEAEISGVANEYTFQFTSGATPTSLTLPDTIQWVNGEPSIEANKTYQVSIVNNIGLIVSV